MARKNRSTKKNEDFEMNKDKWKKAKYLSGAFAIAAIPFDMGFSAIALGAGGAYYANKKEKQSDETESQKIKRKLDQARKINNIKKKFGK